MKNNKNNQQRQQNAQQHGNAFDQRDFKHGYALRLAIQRGNGAIEYHALGQTHGIHQWNISFHAKERSFLRTAKYGCYGSIPLWRFCMCSGGTVHGKKTPLRLDVETMILPFLCAVNRQKGAEARVFRIDKPAPYLL